MSGPSGGHASYHTSSFLSSFGMLNFYRREVYGSMSNNGLKKRFVRYNAMFLKPPKPLAILDGEYAEVLYGTPLISLVKGLLTSRAAH